MGMDPATSRTIVGVLGNVISFYLFLSPLPTFYSIWKGKSVQGYKPDPYVVTVLNCAMWVFYGMPFVHPNSLLVITINGIGFFIQAFYITIFYIYSDWSKRRKILIALASEIAFFIVIVIITLTCLHGIESRSMLIGMLCIIFNIGMYTSPLTIMSKVIKTKSVKYMPFNLSLANFANGIVWSIYALIKFDPYVLVPNGLGTISGLVQLILYASFYNTTKWDEDESHETSHPQTELSTTSTTQV